MCKTNDFFHLKKGVFSGEMSDRGPERYKCQSWLGNTNISYISFFVVLLKSWNWSVNLNMNLTNIKQAKIKPYLLTLATAQETVGAYNEIRVYCMGV